MLELPLTLVQNELDHGAWDQSQSYRCHEDEIVGCSGCFDVFEALVDGHWDCSDFKVEGRVSCGHPEDRLVHVVGIHGADVLTRDI